MMTNDYNLRIPQSESEGSHQFEAILGKVVTSMSALAIK